MPLTNYLYGRLTRFGVLVAVATALADQATKLWILLSFGIGADAASTPARLAQALMVNAADANVATRFRVGPFFMFILTWNTGISFSLLPQGGPLGQWALLGVKTVAVVLLWVWLAHATSRLTGLSLGLIIGGAVGNAIDRVMHGAVVDFVLFHITTATWTFDWYVFNLADCAIVAGVAALLYESMVARDAAKAP